MKTLFKWLVSSALFLSLAALFGLIGVYHHFAPQLPDSNSLRDIQLQVPLRIYDSTGGLIGEFGEKRRIPVAFADIPETLINAFLAAEDDRFFEHPGVDYQGLARAAAQLILTGKRKQGGSTITMQLARNFFLSPERTFSRKIKEILLALQIESNLSKEEILELYLNKIYLGQHAYGIAAAAQRYYSKNLDQLSLSETATLAGLPKAPSTHNPITSPERARQRRDYVLGRMHELDLIDDESYQAALAEPIQAQLYRTPVELDAPYVAELVRQQMLDRYGEEAYEKGYQVYTSIVPELQTTGTRALRSALDEYDRRHGYRGPAGKLESAEKSPEDLLQSLAEQPMVGELRPCLITELQAKSAVCLDAQGQTLDLAWPGLKWARPYKSTDWQGPFPKQAGDVLVVGDMVHVHGQLDEKTQQTSWRLAQVPQVQGALLALNPRNGAIEAMVGGYDYRQSKFNRAVQAKRQPGSGFKPIIYSAALDAGFTAASLINDAPLVMADTSTEDQWRPQNYSRKFYGPTRLRKALTLSRNLVSIRLLRTIGVRKALDQAARFGFDADQLPANLTLALGSGEVTLEQMARAYAVFANGGFLIEPYLIDRILDQNGEHFNQTRPATACPECPATTGQETASNAAAESTNAPLAAGAEPLPAPRALSPETHYIMNSMLQDVVQFGTATKAKVLGRKDIAGKTGTTNDQHDAWFNGFHARHVAIVWVGFDEFRPLGRKEVGGKAALPAWIDFMRVALRDEPEYQWPVPENIVQVRIDPSTGNRAEPGQENAIFELFRADQTPGASRVERPVDSPFSSPENGRPLTEDLF